MRIKLHDEEEVVEIQENDEATIEFSEEEVSVLRRLLTIADKLFALVNTTDETEEEELPITDEDESEENEEPITDEDEEEENFNTVDSKSKKVKDSKAAPFKLPNRKNTLLDAEQEKNLAVEKAWAARYSKKGGNE
jgi:hypothetical protein